ncbi:protein DGCR6L isoform X2 [Lynx canadensis]|uniref:protein DGCR6L isoform X2 n=1 Tax=Lynx canadensis TaxID=61383 RepID=UPI0011B02352|nr:protein DGCR6L isoform X2 [Lynx canadensis]
MVVKWAGCVSLGPDAEEAPVAPAGGWLGATTMERYGGAFEEAVDGARQQERHYQLLSALQSLVKELPSSFQQRLSYTTLSDLALALLDGTVFEIVQGLLEIQHLTEKSLYNQRLRLQNEHRVLRQALRQKHQEAQQACRPHNLPVLQATQQRELEKPMTHLGFCDLCFRQSRHRADVQDLWEGTRR